ncbi:DUF1883 domain-containing protein [Aquipseudomonas alcaligenes]|uniref:DUF1883 domain-containing protein n=1 Tax=Aquipseudomonas alcaligenes TaxID=43263 RepID=UPI00374805E1
MKTVHSCYRALRFFQPRFQPMKFIHQREYLNEGDTVVIHCSQPCNIRLMNDANFRSFKNGGRHTYHGGAFDRFPARIKVPSDGFWNVTLDTVTRRAVSVTRKPQMDYTIKFLRSSGS